MMGPCIVAGQLRTSRDAAPQLTILLVQLFDFESILARFHHIVVSFVPICQSRKSGARDLGQRTEEQPLDCLVDSPCGKQNENNEKDGERVRKHRLNLD
jgi:hypothetical protein